MGLRVELAGVPGAGKSTLCQRVLRELHSKGQCPMDRDALQRQGLRHRDFGRIGNMVGAIMPGWRRDFLGLPHSLGDWHRFVADYPQFAALVHQWLGEENQPRVWHECVYHAVLKTVHEFQLAQECGQPVLIDEGFAQRLFTLRGYRGLGKPGDAAFYVGKMPLPSALILVDTPPDVCAERLLARQTVPVLLRDEPASRLAERLTEGASLLRDLAEALRPLGVPVLCIQGTGDVGGAAGRIVSFLGPVLAP